jgi:hypothetical protein
MLYNSTRDHNSGVLSSTGAIAVHIPWQVLCEYRVSTAGAWDQHFDCHVRNLIHALYPFIYAQLKFAISSGLLNKQ